MQMQMIFRDPVMTQRYVALCKRKGVTGVIKRQGRKQVVVTQHRNVTEKTKFVSAWAYESCVVEDQAFSHQPSLPLFGRKKVRK